MQRRGRLPPSDDIAIVAIDEASIARYGRFPWSRDLTARALETIASSQPKAIALDVLYSEPTAEANDAALAEAISRAGNAVVAAQLIDAYVPADGRSERQVQWLRPLPQIERAAAAVGHVNISTESDGTARELPLRKMDNEGRTFWSMAVEAVRVGDGLGAGEVQDMPGAVRLGARTLLLANDRSRLNFTPSVTNARVVSSRADQMLIDYIGPTGSFEPRTYSFAEVLDRKIPPDKFRGMYVLVGATAATLGDHVASPFVHREEAGGNQHGTLMPGVEVLANALNTILRERFYRETPDWLAALTAALVAAVVIFVLTITQGRFEIVKQLAALAGLVIAILAVSYFAFTHWLIIPPVVPSLISLAVAAPLTLLRRSLATSGDLDERIAELSSADGWLTPNGGEPMRQPEFRAGPAETIAHLTEADSVAILARENGTAGDYRLLAAFGQPAVLSLSKEEVLRAAPLRMLITASPSVTAVPADKPPWSAQDNAAEGDQNHLSQAQTLRLGNFEDPSGALVINRWGKRWPPQQDLLRLSVELAASYVARVARDERGTDPARVPSLSFGRWILPRGIEQKARALGILHHQLMARARFIDRALRSIEDGLIVADVDGRISFANPRAAEIFGVTENALIGTDLFQRVAEDEGDAHHEDSLMMPATRETLVRLIVDRQPVEREIALGDTPTRHYTLRLSAVSGEDGEVILGIVASLSDVTKQRELEQTKNDVMMLVTHELRTPLTAIQGISEVLSQYDVNAKQRREMHLAINAEAMRLARMINDYLDITRLQSGARPLRMARARVTSIVERALLMLDPLAGQRQIRIVRRFAPNLPSLLVDEDLLAQAVTNLVANAIKYSNPASEVIVELRADENELQIKVADHGYGIAADSLARIFEKFYRVPRLADDHVPGTGLGLAFVREIAEKHGGRVAVTSEPGVGSVFALLLPLSFESEMNAD